MQTLSSAVVDDPSCAVLDNIPEKNHFSDNDDIRFQYYVRDNQPGDTILFKVYRPDGTQKWTSTNAEMTVVITEQDGSIGAFS